MRRQDVGDRHVLPVDAGLRGIVERAIEVSYAVEQLTTRRPPILEANAADPPARAIPKTVLPCKRAERVDVPRVKPVGPEIEGKTDAVIGPRPASDATARFRYHHAKSKLLQPLRRRKAGHPGAHDHYIDIMCLCFAHVANVPRPCQHVAATLDGKDMTVFPFSRKDIEEVLAPLASARTFPVSAYLDHDLFAWEQRHIFRAQWICAGREEDVKAPGAWVLCPATEAGILIVRGEDLQIRAYHNTCPHRANLIVHGQPSSGRTHRWRCDYHGWSFHLDGSLRFAPYTEALQDFDPAAFGLQPVKCATWNGFVFIHLGRNPPSLATGLGDVPELLGRLRMDALRRGRLVSYEVRANWKIMVENFQESHHFVLVHPELEAITPWADSSSFVGDGPWLGGTMDIVDEAETVSEDMGRHGRPFLLGTTEPERRKVFDFYFFPNLLMSVQPDYLLTYRYFPQSPNRTLVLAETFFHPAAIRKGFDPADVYGFWDRTNGQDRDVCERQQVAIRSGGFERGRFVACEDGMHAFDRLVARRYLDAIGDRRSE